MADLHLYPSEDFRSLIKGLTNGKEYILQDPLFKTLPDLPYCNKGCCYHGDDNQRSRVLDLILMRDHHGSHKVGQVQDNRSRIQSL